MTRRISIRNLDVGQYIKKGYSSDDNLLVTDHLVDSEDELERLEEIGLSYCLVPEPEEEEEEAIPPEEREEESLAPEEVLARELDELPTRIDRTQKIYNDVTEELGEVFNKVHGDDLTDTNHFEELNPYLDHLINFMDESPASVSVLTQIEKYDEVALHHSLNVTIYSMIYGDYAGFNKSELMDLGVGALLHDIGKTRLSRKMVQKDGELEEKEWEVVKNHPGKGRQILTDLGLGEIPRKIAYQHHERPDGSGYPEGRTDIHQFARIVSVFDAYEALTAPRSYQAPVNPVEAYQKLKNTFSDYPETRRILRGMIRSLGFFPVGCLVRLNNGDLAVVYRNHPDELKKPIVKVIKRGDDRSIDKPYSVDLKHISGQKELINDRMYNDSIEITEIYGLSQTPGVKDTVETLFRNQGFGDDQTE